jgi:hypothetical protein
MPVYDVVVTTSASTVVQVEADNEDAALLVAEELAHVTLCHTCAHVVEINPDGWTALDDDDEPFGIERVD